MSNFIWLPAWYRESYPPPEPEVPEPDPIHDVKIRTAILDTKTGERYECDVKDRSTYWWTEASGSCDCNRWQGSTIDDDDEDDETPEGICPGAKRYLVVAAEPMLPGYTIANFNKAQIGFNYGH